jgi:hypothetical protein
MKLFKIIIMNCPHCLVEFHAEQTVFYLGHDTDGDWGIKRFNCPNPKCRKDIYYLIKDGIFRDSYGRTNFDDRKTSQSILVRPKGTNRAPAPIEVPTNFTEDYYEACLVLSDSPKASAALSRRSLQLILRDKINVKNSDLSSEIQEVLDSGKLPSPLADSIDAVRNIGNFAAHPTKSKSTGEVVAVEPGEAEWNLDVIEMLFDYYFVQPEKIRLKREELNNKLKDAGKPDMK